MKIFIIIIITLAILYIIWRYYEISQCRIDEDNPLKSNSNFTPSKTIIGYSKFYTFNVDDKRKQIAILKGKSEPIYIDFKDILGVKFIEDITYFNLSNRKFVAGGFFSRIFFGLFGTVVGGSTKSHHKQKYVTKVCVKIFIKDINNSAVLIDCFDPGTMLFFKRHRVDISKLFIRKVYQIGVRDANEIKDTINMIIKHTPKNLSEDISFKISNQLLKLHELKEKGILTETEYLSQKQKILNT